MRQNLVAKQQELLQIHKQRLELELQQTKAKLQEQVRIDEFFCRDKQMPHPTDTFIQDIAGLFPKELHLFLSWICST